MQGGTVVFLAGCAFVAFGLLAMQGVASALWRGRRFHGRADGKLIALETPDGRSFRNPADVSSGPGAPLSFRQVAEFSAGGATYQARGPFLMRNVTKEIVYGGGQGTVTTTVAPLNFQPGATLPVVYNRADPRDAMLRGPSQASYWFELFSIQTFIGFMCVVVGLIIFFFNGNLAWLGADWRP